MNKWLLTARLVKDPEIAATQTGKLIASLNVAIRREYKDKNTGQYESDFFRFKSFNTTADYIHKYLKKGDLVEIEAGVSNNNYEKDGEKVYKDEYIINSISRLVSKRIIANG